MIEGTPSATTIGIAPPLIEGLSLDLSWPRTGSLLKSLRGDPDFWGALYSSLVHR
jgi:hypothetical protein